MASRTALAVLILLTAILVVCRVASSAEDEGDVGLVQSESRTHYHPRRASASECPSKCNRRCSKAGEHKRCSFNCLLCCNKCRCVPPGTYGNKEACPCYANMKNSKGKGKCP